jgi:hypothetical protein
MFRSRNRPIWPALGAGDRVRAGTYSRAAAVRHPGEINSEVMEQPAIFSLTHYANVMTMESPV